AFWLYDPQTGTFVYNDDLTRLENPDFDSETKKIRSSGTTCAAGCGVSEIYTLEDGKLILQESETRDLTADGKYLKTVIQKRRDGGMMEVSRTWESILPAAPNGPVYVSSVSDD